MVEVHYLCASESARPKSRRRVSPPARALLVATLIILAPRVAAAQMLSGSYQGDGADDRAITELGFQPDVVIIKGDNAQIGVIRTSTMTGDAAKPMTGATGLAVNLIQSLDTSGFTIGWDPRVNNIGEQYYWVAFRAVPGKMKVGTYTGNGAVGRAVTGVGFPGDAIFVMSASTAKPIAVTTGSLAAGANGLDFFTTSVGGWFTSIDTDGFTLNSAVAENNANTVPYHYIVWNEVQGQIDQGTYVGNGADLRNITGVGFEPEYVITFSSNGQEANHHPASLGAAVDDSMFFAGLANLNNRIQALQADGFQVGTALDVNENLRNHFYIAWTRIQGPPQVLSGSYIGNLADNRAITGLGFRPDFVIVKGNTTENAVFRSSRMDGDVSKPAVGATATAANLVQSLTADGFTIGTDPRVNASGIEYHWIAFSAGPGEMVVNTYTGNGAASRSFTGLGFQPELVWILPAAANEAVWRSSEDTASYDFASSGALTLITALGADGFTVNSDARVNANGAYYYYVAWNQIAGKMDVGSYSGDGSDYRAINGVGFQPEYVFVKRTASGFSALQHPASLGAAVDLSFFFDNRVAFANYIQALLADGFEVGDQSNINASGGTYRYAAWKRPVLTAVRMASTKATRTPNGVTVTWRTGYEVDNLGFDVYREVGGEHTKVTSKPIAGSALFVPTGIAMSAGRPYTWSDESPLALEKDTRYWVEDIDLNGKRTLHGPISPASDKDKDRENETQKLPSAQPRDVTTPAAPAEPVSVRPEPPATNSPLLEDLRLTQTQPEEATPPPSSSPTVAATPARVPDGPIYLGTVVSPHDRRAPTSTAAAQPAPAAPARSGGAAQTGSTPVRTTVTAAPQTRSAAAASMTPTSVASTDARGSQAPPDASGAPTGLSSSQSPWSAPAVAAPVVAEPLERRSEAAAPAPPRLRPGSPPVVRVRPRPTSVAGAPSPDEGAAMQQQWAIASQTNARIAVRARGWYRLTRATLLSAGISPAVDPRNLRLVVDGVERPMIVTGQADGSLDVGDTVEFYGTGVDTPYTDRRAYWITSGTGAGLRLPVVDARTAGTPPGASFAHTVERKDREIFFAALQNGDEENFFGPLIMEGALTTQELTLPHLADPPAADAQLEVSLQGVTELQAVDDHRVGVLVNGTEVGEMVFDGRAGAVTAFPVAHTLLTSGVNTIGFEARGGIDDMTLVESVRLTYQRAYRADGNQVTLTADAGQELTLTGFTNAAIRVFDVTGNEASRELLGTITADGGGWSIRFTVPAGAAPKLFVTTTDVIGTPAAEETSLPSTLHSAGQAGDVVMIADRAFMSGLTPLRNLRESQGYAVQVVDVQDVYDEFSYGQKTPSAIRAFLMRAAKSWARPPRFVLLVGNATTDPRDYQGFGEPDLVPTRIVSTDILETASDDWFADADGDSFAELAAVGRLPARTAAEVSTMVDKIVAYEQSSSETWHRSVLLVSDQGDDDPGSFAAMNTAVGTIVPGDYQVNHLQRALDPTPAETLRTRFQEGALLVNYQGHGSVDLWRGNLLTAADVPALDNGSRLPLVVAMTCFGGFFHGLFPEESLAEALVRASNGGAVGVWASSGMTDAASQAAMDRELFRQVFRGSWTSIGEALRAAKQKVGNADVRRTWIFFGDPALRLKGLSQPPVESTPTVTPVSSPPDPPDDQSASQESGLNRRPSNIAVRLADFDGDGNGDAFLSEPESGSWFSALGEPGSFRYTPGQFAVPGEPMALRLNNDNRADLFVYNPQTGAWLMGMSLGDGRFESSSGSWEVGLQVVPGDFDGNGRDDLFAFKPGGIWFYALSDGESDFSYRFGFGLQPGDAYVADFNADTRSDVFIYNAASGQWTMAFSNDGIGPNVTVGMWTAGWQPVVANLNGDNSADIVLWHAASGNWVLCQRDASQFFVYRTGTWAAGGRLHAGNVNGDARDELLRYDWQTGDWTLATLTLAGEMQQWDGLWETGWEVTPGDLNGDGRDDVLLYNPDTGHWVRRLNLVFGWVDEASGLWSRNWTVAGRRR